MLGTSSLGSSWRDNLANLGISRDRCDCADRVIPQPEVQMLVPPQPEDGLPTQSTRSTTNVRCRIEISFVGVREGTRGISFGSWGSWNNQ